MTRRMLDSGMWANERFAELPAMARLLQIGIINHADDQGRMKAHPLYLRSQIFPYDDIGIDDIQRWLALIEANETITLYEVDGKQFLQLLNWWDYQSPSFASPSDYPRPDGWQDRIRYTGKGRIIYTCNWIAANGDELKNNCDQDGKPLKSRAKKSSPPPAQPPEPESEPEEQSATPPEAESHKQPYGQASEQSHDTPHGTLNEYKYKNKQEQDARAREERPSQSGKPAAATATELDSNLAEFVRAYEQTWGMLPDAFVGEKIQDWSERVPLEAWQYALTETREAGNQGKWKYFEKILNRVEREGMGSNGAKQKPQIVLGEALDNPWRD